MKRTRNTPDDNDLQRQTSKVKHQRRRQPSSTAASVSKRIDFTSGLLSEELLLHIFSFLPAADLTSCTKVNTKWLRLSNDEMLWKPLFLNRFQSMSPALASPRSQWSGACNSSIKERRSSEWKSLYRINHNWRIGNCTLTQLDLHDEHLFEHQHQQHDNKKALAQFDRDILCLASLTKVQIDVYRMGESGTSPVLVGCVQSDVDDRRLITCLKLEKNPNRCHYYRLVAGYDNGGFTLWEFDTTSLNFEATELVTHSPAASHHASYTNNHHPSSPEAVEAIALSFPVLLTCTKSMKLSAYYVDPSPRLIYELQSPIRWSPIVVEMDRCQHEPDRWRAMACFGMPVGLNAYSVGVQEVIFSSQAIVSSRHSAAIGERDMFFPAYSRSESLEPITALVYSEPYLMTAHANNTIKQYHVVLSKQKLEVQFIQTLYGHTSKVHALALNTSVGRLVSGDRYGLKVWDLASSGRPRFCYDETADHHSNFYRLPRHHVGGNEYLVAIDGTSKPKPPIVATNTLAATAAAATTTSVEIPYCDMRWLQFDNDKIVAALRDEQRCYSSNSSSTMFTSPKRVRVKIWSFC